MKPPSRSSQMNHVKPFWDERKSMQPEEIYQPPRADLETLAPALAQPKPLTPFFQTSPLKVALLSIATLGIYHLYWFYKQWDRRKMYGEDVIPVLRAIFGVLFAYSLFQSVNRDIERNAEPGVSFAGLALEPLNAGGLALGYFFLNMLWRFTDLVSLAGLFAFVPLMVVQKRINKLHADLGYDPAEGFSYSAGTIAMLVIGGLFWLLIIVGLLMPQA
jgi:hypothetical protein